MIEMAFRGISWVGNVYQKFEAMCLEVEEVVCEDTVKYVENQVQTVGASVKKFYSEVMQDVLDPSSIEPVKVAAADLSLNPYADFNIHKKPRAGTKIDNVTSYKRGSEDLKAKAEQKVLNRDIGFNGKSRGVIKRISRRENNLSSEVSQSFRPPCKDLNSVSTRSEKMGENHDVATHQIDTGLSTQKRSDCSCVEDIDNVASSIVSTDDMILPSKSVTQKERQLKDASSHNSSNASSGKINDACGNDGVNSSLGPYVSYDPKNTESATKDSSPEGAANLDSIESNNDIAQLREEDIQDFDKSNCVVVGREDLSVACLKEDKPRSYKKKIQKAFSSKRSARKQEYKQLAMQHGCLGSGPNQDVEESSIPEHLNEEESPPYRISEPEWELL